MLRWPFIQRPNPGDLVLGRTGKFSFFPMYYTPLHARAAHLYCVGLSGKGKSKFLEYCLYQDIACGRGAGLIDPHSLLADDLLRLLITQGVLTDQSIRKRLIIVDPADENFVIPFNVLVSGASAYDTAAGVMEAFRRTWPDSLQEAPHFSNVVMASLIALIENKLTLMDMPALLTNDEFREYCLKSVTDQSVLEFFHNRYDKWGKEAPLMRESTLNKIGAFSLNPRLKLMLGQQRNALDFADIMDNDMIFILDLGRSDSETNRLIGSLVMTGFEIAMRRRKQRNLWSLTIDEFAGYVANEGSTKTLAHVFSEARKFSLSLTVAHQTLSQLSPRMRGALGNVQTKAIFGVDRDDAEFFAKLIGRVDTEAVKREKLHEKQYELFEPLVNQWEKITDQLRFQPARRLTVSGHDGKLVSLWTMPIPRYSATDSQVEAIRQESMARFGIPYAQAKKNIEESNAFIEQELTVPPYDTRASTRVSTT